MRATDKIIILAKLDARRTYECELREVTDGDTAVFLCLIDVDINGPRYFSEKKYRLARIDAPEANKPGGAQATRFLRSLLKNAQKITLKPTRKGKYAGRRIAEVWADGENVSDIMLKAGYARPYAN